MLKSLHLVFNGQPNRRDSAIALMHSMRELAMEMMTVPLGDGNKRRSQFRIPARESVRLNTNEPAAAEFRYADYGFRAAADIQHPIDR
jgi:hypothetical protein